MGKEKIQIKVEVTPQAKEQLEKVCRDRDMTQIGVISRLIAWFAQADELTQTIVLGLIPTDLTPGALHANLMQMLDSMLEMKAQMEKLREEGKIGQNVGRFPPGDSLAKHEAAAKKKVVSGDQIGK